MLRSLRWPFSVSETKELLKQVKKHQAAISVALSGDTLATVLRALSRQDKIAADVDELKCQQSRRWAAEDHIRMDERRKEILIFFSKVNPSSNHTMSLKLAFVYFGRAFNSVRELLDRQVLLFLPYLYHMLLPDQIIRRQEVFSQLLDFIAQMVMTSYPNLRPIQQSLFLLRRMSIEDRGQSSERVFQSIVDRVLVYFESDMLHNPEPDANQIYLRGREEVLAKQNIDNYRFTPIVLRVFASGADFFHRQRIGHMYLDYLRGHGALKPEIVTEF